MRKASSIFSTLAFDVINGVALMGLKQVGAPPPFHVEIVGEAPGPLTLAGWEKGRYQR